MENPAVFKDKLQHPAYPVAKLGGLLFTYMGAPEKNPFCPNGISWSGKTA
jgi:hypothetical protein